MLCANTASDSRLSVSVGGVVDAGCRLLCEKTLGTPSDCHADYMLVFIPHSSERRRTMQVFWLCLCLAACVFKVNFNRAQICQSVISLFLLMN